MPKNPVQSAAEKNPDVDHHLTFVTALRRILEDADFDDVPIERLEVYCHASGDVTYRFWYPRAEESEGGWLPPR